MTFLSQYIIKQKNNKIKMIKMITFNINNNCDNDMDKNLTGFLT